MWLLGSLVCPGASCVPDDGLSPPHRTLVAIDPGGHNLYADRVVVEFVPERGFASAALLNEDRVLIAMPSEVDHLFEARVAVLSLRTGEERSRVLPFPPGPVTSLRFAAAPLDGSRALLVVSDKSFGHTFLVDASSATFREVGLAPAKEVPLIDLGDGRALMLDGTSRADVFEPRMETWQSLPLDEHFVRFEKTVALEAGRVLVLGRHIQGRDVLPSAHILSVDEGTAFEVAPPSVLRTGAGIVRMGDGRVLLFGGQLVENGVSGGSLSSTEIYDPAEDTWTAGPDLGLAQLAPSGFTDGMDTYVFGGLQDPPCDTRDCRTERVMRLGTGSVAFTRMPDMHPGTDAYVVAVRKADAYVVAPFGAFKYALR